MVLTDDISGHVLASGAVTVLWVDGLGVAWAAVTLTARALRRAGVGDGVRGDGTGGRTMTTSTTTQDRIPDTEPGPGPYSDTGYASRRQILAGETEHGDAVYLDTRAIAAARIASLEAELAAAYANLAAVQRRCTELLEERRAVDWTSQLRSMFVAFDQEVGDHPRWPDDATTRLRRKLVVEEYRELIEALDSRDMPEVADGVIDLCVVALGLLVAFGIDPRPLWDEVMRANMSKAGGPKSSDGKIMKRPDFVPPDVRGILVRMGWSGR